MRGKLVSIYAQNFMMFDELDFKPGPNINIIIEPCDFGKSTIVAAIVLGLGGKPEVLTYGSSIGSFVKNGCDTAKIKIELGNPEGRNDIITRTITVDNKSTWTLNGVDSSQKQIDETTERLKIQVDNLCQFLPQDRVQDFLMMTPQMLLENMEKSVGPVELTQYHEHLKEVSVQFADLELKLKDKHMELQYKEQQNARVAVVVENMREKKALLAAIQSMKEKRGWLQYSHIILEHNRLKETKKEMTVEFQEYKNRYQPFPNIIENARAKVNSIKDRVKSCVTDTAKKLATVKGTQQKFDRTEDSIEYADQECQLKVETIANRQSELQVLYQQLDTLKNDLMNFNKEPDHVICAQVNEGQIQMQQVREKTAKLHRDRDHHQHMLENINHAIRAQEQQRQNALDVPKLRLELMKRRFPDAYEAVIWLRGNQYRFKEKIYEPMILEINITDPGHSKYVENVIPVRDLQAFTCENREDMNLFMKLLRDEKDLKINVVHSGREHPASNTYRAPIPIDQLKEFGFTSYLIELLTAPEPILKYLCRKTNLHQIPLGTSHINSIFETIPSSVTSFLSDTHLYGVSFSKYERAKITTTDELNELGLLNISVDMQVLQSVEHRLNELNVDKENITTIMMGLEQTAKNEDVKLEGLREQKKKLQEVIENRRILHAHLKSKQNQIQNMEENQLDTDAEKSRCKESIRGIVLQQCCIFDGLSEEVKQYENALTTSHLLQVELDDSRSAVFAAEREAKVILKKYQDAEIKVRECEQQLVAVKAEEEKLYVAALKMSNGIKPAESFFLEITSTLQELDKDIAEHQAKADYLGDINDEILREFETRKCEISNITTTIDDHKVKLEEVKQTLMSGLQKWLPPLQDLINKINVNFGNFFMQMGWAGEVLLTTGKNPEDYTQYGIQIKVKYHDSQEFPYLDQFLLSAEERSVAIAIYMITLQELTHVPFHCVAEINQGTDPVNERRVFNLLMNAASRSGTVQYFLLTPKLLRSLTYTQQMKVVCINNVTSHIEFDVEKTIQTVNNKKQRSSSTIVQN